MALVGGVGGTYCRCPMGFRRDTTSAAHEGTAEVTRFADIKADRERREREDLQRGLVAAIDAIYEWTRPRQDVRVAVIAMYGDPYAGVDERTDPGRSVPVEAQFISLDQAKPLTDAQRRHLAIETVRAASEPLYREISLGLALADLIEDLAQAAESGDAKAEARHTALMDALGGDPPPTPGEAR
jgi:hypothetical protein